MTAPTKVWVVSCDACPFRHRFEAWERATEEVARHATENPKHNPKVTEEEQ